MSPTIFRRQLWVAVLITAATLAMIAAVGIWATPDFAWPL